MESNWEFGRLLIDQGLVQKEELEFSLNVARHEGERIGEVLVRLGYLTREQLHAALSTYLSVPRISLAQVRIDSGIAQRITEDMAWRYKAIPVALKDNTLSVAIADPTCVGALDDIRLFTGCEVLPILANEEEIEAAIREHLTVQRSAAQLVTLADRVAESTQVWSVEEAPETGRDAPTIRLVDSIIQQAVTLAASDIHWEPREEQFLVRFRVDGQMVQGSPLPLETARSVLSRLKMMAKMDVAERRLPQDGRLAIDLGTRRIDLRVSTLPTVYGEKAVVRILDPETAQRTLSALGMRLEVERELRRLLARHHGLILVTGPTGSGKTTTLYALVRELQAGALNIVSIEDPVEYRLPGVNQVQVHSKIGLTFAFGLRAILRQDPDVIMVGEIRDEETARIAVTAALTGHLVLSTLHTNTAAEALTRLLDMGIEPYLLAEAISAVLSQRLVRVLCPSCKTYRSDGGHSLSQMMGRGSASGLLREYQARGCPECRGSGYKGRIGLHEFLLYSQAIKELVLARQGSQAIEEVAIQAGMLPLLQDGLGKVKDGLTTLEEVLRAAVGTEEGLEVPASVGRLEL